MRVSFNQPAFIPWGGFFARLLHSELMILFDDTQFARGFTFVNRNRLKGPQGEIWITVPIKKKGRGLQKINQLEIHEPDKWSKKFLQLLKHYYGHSLYFPDLCKKMENILGTNKDNFLHLALLSIDLLKQSFGINTPLTLQSDLGLRAKGTDLLIELAREIKATEVLLPYLADRHLEINKLEKAGLKVFFLRYNQVPYPQFWGNFVANLSALDLYLCCGSEGIKIIEKSSRVIQK